MDGLGECAEKLKEGTLKPRLDSLTGSKEETAGVNAGKGKESPEQTCCLQELLKHGRERYWQWEGRGKKRN